THISPSGGSSSASPRTVRPRSRSAASRSCTPANLTSHRPWCGRDVSMTYSSSSTYTCVPAPNRSGTLVVGTMCTSPWSPCARPTRPSSSRTERLLRDVDGDPHAFRRAGSSTDLTQCLDHAATLADDAAQVAGTRVHEQCDAVRLLVGVDEDTVGVVDEMTRDVFDDGASARAGDAVAFGRDLVITVVVEIVVVEVVVELFVAHSVAAWPGASPGLSPADFTLFAFAVFAFGLATESLPVSDL